LITRISRIRKIWLKNKKFLRNEKGQGMVEYILLLVVVIGLVAIFKNKIVETIKGKTDQVGTQMDNFTPEGQ